MNLRLHLSMVVRASLAGLFGVPSRSESGHRMALDYARCVAPESGYSARSRRT